MKVWVVWAESYEDIQDIWAICGSEEETKRCIANATEQIRHDEERWDEIVEIASTIDHECRLPYEIEREMDEIAARRSVSSSDGGNYTLPFFSIREYNVMK